MGFQCPACASPAVGRAAFLWSDLPQALLLRAAYRCRECGQRFFAPRRSAGDEPRSAHDAPPAAPSSDRRSSARFHCDLVAEECAAGGAGHVVCAGRVLNLSEGGLHLVLPRGAEEGSVIHLRIQPEGSSVVVQLPVHVASVFLTPEGQWALACRFLEPLGKETLKALLRQGSPRGS